METMTDRLKRLAQKPLFPVKEKILQSQTESVSDDLAEDIRRRVEQKAYQLYAARGFQDGADMDDWLEAEKIVSAELKKIY